MEWAGFTKVRKGLWGLSEMKDVIGLEPNIEIPSYDYYTMTYPCIINYFYERNNLVEADVLLGVNIVYGWMPTVPKLHHYSNGDSLNRASKILNKARKLGELDDNEIQFLVHYINNSLSGVSKLLHFIAPESFAIWDSNIFRFVFEKEPYSYRLGSLDNFREYQNTLKEIIKDPRVPSFHRSLNGKIGYKVSALRAIEVLMFFSVKKSR